jgi:excisionase family DNA binding protein
MSDRLLRAREVAELLDVTVETILRWARRGELPAFKLPGGPVRFSEADVEAWLAEHTTAPFREARATHPGAVNRRLSLPPRAIPPARPAPTEEES